jgi:hypothetical protein
VPQSHVFSTPSLPHRPRPLRRAGLEKRLTGLVSACAIRVQLSAGQGYGHMKGLVEVTGARGRTPFPSEPEAGIIIDDLPIVHPAALHDMVARGT